MSNANRSAATPSTLHIGGVQDFTFNDSGVEILGAVMLTDSAEESNELAAVIGVSPEDAENLAAEIARRWNAHADLLAAAEEALRVAEGLPARPDYVPNLLRAAIRKARGAS